MSALHKRQIASVVAGILVCGFGALKGEDPTPCKAPDAYFYDYDGNPSTAVHRSVGLELQREVAEVFP
jgi:hypothetical protein